MLVEETTLAERLFLWRHRRRLRREEAAAENGVELRTYAAWEDGQIVPDSFAAPVLLGVRHIEPREHYLLLRRRARMSLSDVARAMGVGKQYVSKMERGVKALEPLRRFWCQA